MTLAVMIVAVVAAGIAQSVVPAPPILGEARVPFLLGVVVYYALMREQHVMLTAAVLAGLMQDGLSMVPLGYSSFCFVVVGLLVSRFSDIVFSEALLTTAMFGALASLCMTLGLNLLLGKYGLIWFPARWVALKALGSAVLGALSTPVAFAVTVGMDRIVGNVPRRKEHFGDEIEFT